MVTTMPQIKMKDAVKLFYLSLERATENKLAILFCKSKMMELVDIPVLTEMWDFSEKPDNGHSVIENSPRQASLK